MQRLENVNSILIFIFLLLFSCNKKDVNDDIIILGEVYKSIPKYIPAPPKKESDSNISEEKGVTHNYAINKEYVAESIKYKNGTKFYKYGTDKLFDKEILSSDDENLVRRLNLSLSKGKIDEVKLQNYIKQQILFTDRKYLENNNKIDRVVSFSKPLYNEDKSKSVLYIINYGSGLDSSLSIYLLYKIKNNWVIKFRRQIYFS